MAAIPTQEQVCDPGTTLRCRQVPLAQEVAALRALETLYSFRVDAIGQIYWQGYPRSLEIERVKALCLVAQALEVPTVWVLWLNPEMRHVVTLWLGLVKVYTGRLDRLLDPIVHWEELRELCRQFLGRVALLYSADGLENPVVAIALEAQADPLPQGNSTDVHLQLLE